MKKLNQNYAEGPRLGVAKMQYPASRFTAKASFK
jgi:hypothetical protein